MWLIWLRCVGSATRVVYQVRMSRVLPTGRSPSNTASSRKVFCSITWAIRCWTMASMCIENKIRLRSESW